MDVDKDFADPALEAEGVWLEYREGSEIKIARLGNPRFRKAYQALMKPYREMERRGTIPQDRQTEILCRAYAQTVLLDWRGFNKGGKALKYTEDAAYRLLVALLDFRNDVTRMAAEEDSFKIALTEDAEKNLPTS